MIFGLILWTLASGYFPAVIPYMQPSVYWGVAFISAIMLFISLVLHEFAHAVVAIKNDIPIKKITLFIFGGVAHMEKEPDSPGVEFRMALAGPIASLAIALLFYIAARLLASSGSNVLAAMFNYIAFMNLSVVLFNVIPGFPLDGGRVLRAVIWKCNQELRAATRFATWIGRGVAYIFIAIGAIIVLSKMPAAARAFPLPFNISLLHGVWFIVIGIFLHEAAEMSYQQLILKKALVGVPVKDVMQTNVTTVTPDIKLDVLVNEYFYKFRYMGFPVVENGCLKGMVTLHAVKEVPSDKWSSIEVSQVMSECRSDLLIDPCKDALDALVQVTKSGLGRLLVVENGCLLGIATQRDLLKLFEIKAHLGG